MEIWEAILLGAIQGFTEFLPVSSSGHLLLLHRWLGVSNTGMFFDVILHIGSLIPVVVVLFKEILNLFKIPKRFLFLVIATIPAVITGYFLGDLMEGVFYANTLLSAILLALTFIMTATELYLADRLAKKRTVFYDLDYKRVTVMGIAQGIAIMPGLSRSGTVISAGSLSGLKNSENAVFSFLMSIPVIIGAALLSGYKAIKEGIVIEVLPLVFGAVTAMVTGYIAIKVMLAVAKKANFKWFSLYLVIIAVLSVGTKLIFNV